jgi:hypothetical protein
MVTHYGVGCERKRIAGQNGAGCEINGDPHRGIKGVVRRAHNARRAAQVAITVEFKLHHDDKAFWVRLVERHAPAALQMALRERTDAILHGRDFRRTLPSAALIAIGALAFLPLTARIALLIEQARNGG